MRPRVLLINLPYVVKNIDASRPKIRSFLGFPCGLLSMATYNKDYADIKIIDCDTEIVPLASILRSLQEFKPDIVGLSMMFDNSYKSLAKILEMVKEFYPHMLTILGGAAASYSYEEILSEQKNLDAICYSEGEIPLRRLLRLEDSFDQWDMTHPAWITRDKLRNGVAPKIAFIENLDDVIDIDYSLVDPNDYDMQEAFSPFVDHGKHKQFFLVTSRGCPFSCRFCSNGKIHGKRMRAASVDAIIDHVQRLVHEYGMDILTIYDDQLLINMPRAKALFKRLAEFNLRIECPNGLSVRYLDEEMAGLMRRAGMDTASLAIESGSNYVLKELISKPLELSQVKPAVAALRQNDFFIHGFFVMGMPGETDVHRLQTRRFVEDIDLDWCGFNMATPVRGSRLYDDCINNGWIKKQRIEDIVDKKYIIHVPGTDPEKIEADVYQMNLDINFHNNRRMRIGNYETAKRCFEEVIRRYDGHEIARHYLKICEGKLNERNRTVRP
jgi:radical SAM superfamily enzyme YgiQ (UPF0313 family)